MKKYGAESILLTKRYECNRQNGIGCKPVSSVKVRRNHLKVCYSAKDEVAMVSNVPEEREKSQTAEEEIEVEFLSELELDEVSELNSFFIL